VARDPRPQRLPPALGTSVRSPLLLNGGEEERNGWPVEEREKVAGGGGTAPPCRHCLCPRRCTPVRADNGKMGRSRRWGGGHPVPSSLGNKWWASAGRRRRGEALTSG
jgi:hypothetical protein